MPRTGLVIILFVGLAVSIIVPLSSTTVLANPTQISANPNNQNTNARNLNQNRLARFGKPAASRIAEPATMLLLGTGLLGAAGAVRRRLKK